MGDDALWPLAEGNTLVVETTNFRDAELLHRNGNPKPRLLVELHDAV